jgi:hypothetical protein
MIPSVASGKLDASKQECFVADVGLLRHPFSPSPINMGITGMTLALGGYSPTNVTQHVTENGAPQDILGTLEDLPDFTNNRVADVMKALGDEERGEEDSREHAR